MKYQIKLNKNKIRNIGNSAKLTYSQVRKVVTIDEKHFLQKSNWYIIDNYIHYFKTRNDCRIIGELLSCDFFNVFNVPTANYEIVTLGRNKKVGLISQNIQTSDYFYLDLSNLHKIFPELPRKYGEHTLEKLLKTLENNEVPNIISLRNQLIVRYILDWFVNQLDRNPKNILFEIDNLGNINISKMIDNESSFSIKKGVISTEYQKIWIPALPYNDSEFKTHPETIDDCDSNVFGLLVDYPEEVSNILKQIIDYNFDQIIQSYSKKHDPKVYLEDDGISFLKEFVYKKQEQAYKMNRL